jgi:hypothetical protein
MVVGVDVNLHTRTGYHAVSQPTIGEKSETNLIGVGVLFMRRDFAK